MLKAQPMSPAARRYLTRFMPTMTVYVAALMASIFIMRGSELAGPLLWLLAVLPALPLVGIIAIIGLYLVEETDEFQRTVLVQCILWGAGVTLSAATVWGFLENADLIPHMPAFMWFPVFCASMGLAQPIVRWRYR